MISAVSTVEFPQKDSGLSTRQDESHVLLKGKYELQPTHVGPNIHLIHLEIAWLSRVCMGSVRPSSSCIQGINFEVNQLRPESPTRDCACNPYAPTAYMCSGHIAYHHKIYYGV